MPRQRQRLICALTATVLASAAAFTSAQRLDEPRSPEADRLSSADRVTITGCVIHEAAYARATSTPAAGGTARDTDAEFVIVVDRARGEVYSVTGPHEAMLAAHAGRRIAATGTIEAAPAAVTEQLRRLEGRETPVTGTGERVEAPLPRAGASGVTPEGGPAHEPADAAPGTIPPSVVDSRAASVRAHDSGAPDLHALPRLNLTTAEAVDGRCEPVTRATTAVSEPAHAPAPPVAPARSASASVRADTDSVDADTMIEALGCLVRWTPTGAALTAGPGDLALTRASTGEAGQSARTSAVPGSQPSGRGSGTVRPLPTGATGWHADGTGAFLLDTSAVNHEELARHVGQRVGIVGTTRDAMSAPATVGASTAGTDDRNTQAAGVTQQGGRERGGAQEPSHQTAPSQHLRVATFRLVGGHCF